MKLNFCLFRDVTYRKFYISNLIFFIILACVLLRSNRKLSDWVYTHWIFNYEYGFVKRGLVGELLRILDINAVYENVQIISFAFVLVCICVLLFVFSYPLRKRPDTLGVFLFFLCVVLNPATLQHVIFDVGRFDSICLLLCLFSIFCIKYNSCINSFIAILFLSSISILIHEASFFIYIPLVLSYYALKNRNNVYIWKLLFLFLVLFVLTYLVSTYGLLGVDDFRQYSSMLALKYGRHVSEESMLVLYHGSLLSNIKFTMSRFFVFNSLLHHFSFFLVFISFIFLIYNSIKSVFVNKDIFECSFIMSSFTPLLLYPIGIDHFRWWSLSIMNLSIAICLLSDEENIVLLNIAHTFERYKKISLFFIMMSLAVGPLGVVRSFNFLNFLKI